MKILKRIAAFVIAGAALLTAGCGDSQASHEQKKSSGKVLVVYFSNPQSDGTDVDTHASRNRESKDLMGNVEYAASLIRQKTNAEVFRIETKDPYPAQYKATADQAKKEQNEKARPALKTTLRTLMDMILFILGIRTGGATCLCLFTRSLMRQTCRARRYIRLCATAAARLLRQFRLSKSSNPRQRFRTMC